jgi:hypothetical protein
MNGFVLFSLIMVGVSGCGGRIQLNPTPQTVAVQNNNASGNIEESYLKNSARYHPATSYTPVWTISTSSENRDHFAIKACSVDDCQSGCLAEISPATSGATVLSNLQNGSSYYICIQEVYKNSQKSNWSKSYYPIIIDNPPAIIAPFSSS